MALMGVFVLARCAGGTSNALKAMGTGMMVSRLSLEVDLAALAAAFTVSAVVGILFGTWPARRAAALSPVDALARE